MSFDRRFFRPLGALSVFVAVPVMEAGLMAARPTFESGDYLATLLTLLGSLGAILLFIAGILLCARRTVGRTFAYWGTGVSVPAHIVGALIGLMGGHAVLYGVGYPVVLVLLLSRATPSSGIPGSVEDPEPQTGTSHDGAHLMSALAGRS